RWYLLPFRRARHDIAEVLDLTCTDFHVHGHVASEAAPGVGQEIEAIRLARDKTLDAEPAILANLGKAGGKPNRVKKAFSQRLAIGIDHSAHQRAPGLEGYPLGGCLIAMECQFAGQPLFLVKEA